MIQVHLVGYTADLRHLVLDIEAGSGRGRYRLALDEDLFLTIDEVRTSRLGAGLDSALIARNGDGVPVELVAVSEDQAVLPGIVSLEPVPLNGGVGDPDEALFETLRPQETDTHEPVYRSVSSAVRVLVPRQRETEPLFQRPAARRLDATGEFVRSAPPIADTAPTADSAPATFAAPPVFPPAAAPPPAEPPRRTRPRPVPAPAPPEPVAAEDQTPSRSADSTPAPATDAASSKATRRRGAKAPPPPPPPPPASNLTPAQIQTLLRSGRTPRAVAKLAGTDVSRVERWLPPILAERQQVLAEARAATTTRSRLGASGAALGDAVETNLAGKGVDPDGATWSASRRSDGRWKVSVRYHSRGKARAATWMFDRDDGTVVGSDEHARALGWTPPRSRRRRATN